MKIIINNNEYKSKKLTGEVYENYLDSVESIDKYQTENKKGWDSTALSMARDFIVELFNEQFSADDVYKQVDVASTIAYFMAVDKILQDQVTSKIEKLAKNY